MATGREHTSEEELAAAIASAVSLGASLVGFALLVAASIVRDDPWQIVGSAVFGASLVALYAASTVYHALPVSRAKDFWRLLDHSAIYLVIAGTYTPFALGALRGPWGWSLLATVWTLAIAGIVVKSRYGFAFPRLSTGVYLAMGWMGVLAAQPVVTHVDPVGIVWLVAGGLSYTLGVVFFVWEELLFAHTIWHLFVAAGSACHFFAVIGHAAGVAG